MKKGIIALVCFYQKFISPDTGYLKGIYGNGGACRMFPTCSEYMTLAIKKNGAGKGFLLGLIRITRCHPFQKNLIDPP